MSNVEKRYQELLTLHSQRVKSEQEIALADELKRAEDKATLDARAKSASDAEQDSPAVKAWQAADVALAAFVSKSRAAAVLTRALCAPAIVPTLADHVARKLAGGEVVPLGNVLTKLVQKARAA